MKRRSPLFFGISATLLLALSSTSLTHADEWTRFRGPNGTGVSEAATIPVAWTADDYRWQIDLPGMGYSSPIVSGDQLFITSADEDAGKVWLQCLRPSDGQQVWQRDFTATPYRKHKHNGFAATTPTIDEKQIYLTVGAADQVTLMAMTRATGEEVWRREFGTYKSTHGFCSSPMLLDGMVIFTNEQVGQSSIISLDSASGEILWQTPTETEIAAYSTPCVYQPETGKAQLIVTSSNHSIRGLDPTTGEQLWAHKCFENRVVGSPILASGLVIASGGQGGVGREMYAVKPGNEANGMKPELAYAFDGRLPYVPTSVTMGELLFVWHDKGMARCFHAPTGRLIWEESIGGSYYTSPIRVADRLYCISMQGEMIVLAADDQYKELARFDLGEPSFATPAVADGVMYVRTHTRLMAIGGVTP